MKRFIWLIVLAAAGYAVWKYYPEIEHKARELTGGLEESVAPEEAAAPSAEPAPATAVSPQAKETAAAPAFASLEEVVGGWKKIPPSAFPRRVELKKATRFTLVGGQGSALYEAGAKVYALSAQDDALTIASSLDGPMRAKVRIDDTDFKQVLAGVYEAFKERRRAELARPRETARPAAGATGKAAGAEPPPAALSRIGPRPPQQPDGKVPVMLASIAERRRTKQTAEPALEDITAWRDVGYREINGEPYWCGSLTYTARTIFGEFPTDAVALIRHGKVVQWLYAGTSEPLP